MFRCICTGLAMIASVVIASPVFAVAVQPSSSMLAIQLSNGTGNFSLSEFNGFITAYDHSEWGGQVQYWKMMGADYAFWVSGGVGRFNEVSEGGDNAPPEFSEIELLQKSWNVRIGGDRVVNIGDRGAVYFGPGLEYWTGRAEVKYENTIGVPDETRPNVRRISLIGRIGGVMSIGKSWGLTGHVGHRVGYATAEEAGAKVTWWPSSFDGAGGLVFMFGGSE